MRYMVVVEKGPRNYSAFSPDVPGCVATGRTLEEITMLMREGIEYALEDMLEFGSPIPEPTSWTIVVKGYNVPITKTGNGYRAEPTDLPYVVAAADTPERVKALVRETIALHLCSYPSRKGPPEPTSQIVYVEVEAPEPVSA